MAGAETETVLLHRKPKGDNYDRAQITLMAAELDHSPPWERLEPRLRAMTRMLVHRHRARIERVAKALLAKKTLSAARLNKLIGRSVDDVQMNWPLALQMSREGYY